MSHRDSKCKLKAATISVTYASNEEIRRSLAMRPRPRKADNVCRGIALSTNEQASLTGQLGLIEDHAIWCPLPQDSEMARKLRSLVRVSLGSRMWIPAAVSKSSQSIGGKHRQGRWMKLQPVFQHSHWLMGNARYGKSWSDWSEDLQCTIGF